MYRQKTIVQWLVFLGMLSAGCTYTKPGGQEFSKAPNRIDRSGLKQGPWEIYADTVLRSRGSYVDGEPDGLWIYWYENGQKKEEGHYSEGLKNGMWIEWYPDGEIMWKGEWDQGNRHLEYLGAAAELSFIGQEPVNNVLSRDSLYHLRIRVQNMPANYLFVEVSKGEIAREENSDLFTLKTPSDSLITLAVGYVPDPKFKDFRNLISEIDFKLK